MSRFSSVEQGEPAEVYVLNEAFEADRCVDKVNLGGGVYRTDEGKPWVLPAVRTAENALAADVTLNKEYLPVLGQQDFTVAATNILLGTDSLAVKENRIDSSNGSQAIGCMYNMVDLPISRIHPLQRSTQYKLPVKRTESTSMSRFSSAEQAPPIEVFALNQAFVADTCIYKVNLGQGVYRTDEGKPWVLPAVRAAEKALAADETLNKEYLPVLGQEGFTKAATNMLLGDESPAIKENRAFGVQCLSGTGALRVGAELFARILGYRVFYYSKQTWANHKRVFCDAGFSIPREYRYWSESQRGFDFDAFLEDMRNAPENSVIILHPCAHNPTGCDPTQEQWAVIADVMEERRLVPFFDSAYQGFASGDLEKDAWSVRYFVSRGFELVCAQSFAKNFGLYNERIGNLTFVLKDPKYIPQVKSQVTLIVRGMYSNPPSHGARIITHILNDPALYHQWKGHIKTMSSRIMEMRKLLRAALERLQTPGDWSHITTQIGMFSYTGLNERQSLHMIEKHHVYMLRTGRISMCGLTTKNVEYVARAIHETVTNVK